MELIDLLFFFVCVKRTFFLPFKDIRETMRYQIRIIQHKKFAHIVIWFITFKENEELVFGIFSILIRCLEIEHA